MTGANLLRCAEAVHLRHGKVKYHKVGLPISRHRHGFPTGGSFTADLPAPLFQGFPDKPSHHGMVVGDKNTRHHLGSFLEAEQQEGL